MPTKLLTVIGATGIQGSSVVDAALTSNEQWKIRAITRNPQGDPGRPLQAKGIEVIKADLNDASTLETAFAGSHAIFAATDFFGPFAASNANAAKAEEIEWTQTKNIIEAALTCKSLQHFIWSTLPHASRISNGKYEIGHFKAKNRGEDMIRSHPSLLAITSFAYVGWYATNFVFPSLQPAFLETTGAFVQLAPARPDVPLYTIGDPRANIGKFVLAALAHPEITLPGRCIHVAIEETTMAKLLEDWSTVTGKTARYVQTTVESYDALWPGWGKVEGDMLQFYDDFRHVPWLENGEKMIMASDLGLDESGMVGVVDALKTAGI